MNSFVFFFMILEATWYTRYTRYQSYRQQKGDTMAIKNYLYLRIILLINYVMEENLFVNVEYSPVKHATSRFSVRKNVAKKKKRVTTGRTDISGPGPCQFFIQRFDALHYADST